MNKRICFINSSKEWGGGESWQYETMLDFKEKEDIISFCSPKGALYEKVSTSGINTISISVGNFSYLNPFKILWAYRLFKRTAPDVILFNTSNDFKMFTMPAKWAGVKHRLYRRDNGTPLKTHIVNQFLFNNGVTGFLPCSTFIKEAALKKKQDLIQADNIEVIYNSINLKKWDSLPSSNLDLNKKPEEVIFGCIGRLSHEKGLLFLPEIAKSLSQNTPNFKILVAGKGSLKLKLETKIAEYGVESYIELLGFVKSNKEFIETIDCLLLPSYWEGLPTVAIEAMASKKPVIAFDVAGNPEVIIDKKTGFLATPFNTKEMAEKMFKLVSNPEQIKKMGEAGRILAEKQFSKEITNIKLRKSFHLTD